MKTEEEYQVAIELNDEQEKAFRSLERAIKKCKEANIYFYMVLNSLGALNGNNVARVEGDSDLEHVLKTTASPDCLMHKDYPYIGNVTDAWADDSHFIKLKQ